MLVAILAHSFPDSVGAQLEAINRNFSGNISGTGGISEKKNLSQSNSQYLLIAKVSRPLVHTWNFSNRGKVRPIISY